MKASSARPAERLATQGIRIVANRILDWQGKREMKHCAPLIRKAILSTGNGFLRGNCGPRQGLGQAPPAAIRRSAELRAQAAVAVDALRGSHQKTYPRSRSSDTFWRSLGTTGYAVTPFSPANSRAYSGLSKSSINSSTETDTFLLSMCITSTLTPSFKPMAGVK